VEKNKKERTFLGAKKYVFLLLKFRLRSEKEIRERLKRKNFAEETIKKTLFFLKKERFLDDNYFARSWIEARLKKNLSLRKLQEELAEKGIDKKIIDRQIEEVKKEYSEREAVLAIVRERIEKSGKIDSNAAKKRIFAYLLRRGFSAEISMEAVGQLDISE